MQNNIKTFLFVLLNEMNKGLTATQNNFINKSSSYFCLLTDKKKQNLTTTVTTN